MKEKTASNVKLFLDWAFVGIPLCWGVMETLKKAMELFFLGKTGGRHRLMK